MSLFVPSSPTQSSSQANVKFEATTKNITTLSNLLASITPINHQCLLIIKPEGLTFYTVYNHLINILLIIDLSLFKVYNLTGDHLELQVDINLISQAFQSINDNNTTCFIRYNGIGYPLTIEFDNHLLLEKLEFFTFVQEIFIDDNLSINYSNIEFELIIKSDLLYLLLVDLLKIGTIDLNLLTAKSKNNQLFFISRSNIGLVKLIYPSQLIEKLTCSDNSPISQTYKFANFIKILPAIKISSKCKLLKDNQGVLCIQLLCNGNLITFNLLEQLVDSSLKFDDDDLYNYIKTYEQEPQVEKVRHIQLPMFL